MISGARDGLLGREQTAALVSAIPGSQWLECADTGHLVLEEQPYRLAADVLTFIDERPEDGER